MRRLMTPQQALQLDLRTQQLRAVSAESLMERAGERSANEILDSFPDCKRVVVLVGPGNNGGDGLVIARILARVNVQVTVVCPHEGTSELWKKKRDQVSKSGIRWIDGEALVKFLEEEKNSHWDLLVDAAFGVGLSRPLNQLWVNVFEFFDQKVFRRVAIDIPSGLDGKTGVKGPGTLQYDRTYTMGLGKIGLVVGDGPFVSGKIKVLDIGFSQEAVQDLKPKISFFGLQECLRLLPQRRNWNSNKSTNGHLLVIAGSLGMEGAGILASLAGARMGAGYVTWARWPERERQAPSVLLEQILDEDLLFLGRMKVPSAVVVGPGLGINDRSRKLIKNVYRKFKDSLVVVDADALHLLKSENLYPVPKGWVLTPHAGELAQLMDLSVEEINQNRLESVLMAQEKLGGSILLKGYRSLLIDIEQQVFVIGSGGAVLAKAGTGDVLAGMIGGTLARGMEVRTAVLLAAFIHGRAGDLYQKKWKNDFSMLATDLIEMIPSTLKNLYRRLKFENT